MKLAAIMISFIAFTSLPAQTIYTVAGNGTINNSGDGGPAIYAALSDIGSCYPAFYYLGNMYIAQNFNNTIRKIDAAGIITTIAGSDAITGYTGDGGPAVNALIRHPSAIAIDNNNNIYFADQLGTVIRRIDPAGIITTVSGQVTSNCAVGDGGPLLLARFRAIAALSFDASNNLYISDNGCHTLRRVSAGIVTTIAGNGTIGYSGDGGPAIAAQLAFPGKVAIDNLGNVYIPDGQNHRIRKVTNSGIITTIAGTGVQGYSGDNGPATSAQIKFPGSVIIDNAGNLFMGDDNAVIRKINAAGIITTYAGSGTWGYEGDGGPAIAANMQFTEGRISIDHNDNIYFANQHVGNVIRKISNCIMATIDQQPSTAIICSGWNASFSISATNITTYQWQVQTVQGSWVNLNNDAMYSGVNTNILSITAATANMSNYGYRCVASNSCGAIFSREGLLHIPATLTPSVSIVANTSTICTGQQVVFNATPLNGGSAPVYQWMKNGIPVGSNSSTYSDNTFQNGDVVNVTMVSNGTCLTTSTAVSNSITLSVNVPVIVGITVVASANNVCFGTPVTFTATVTNGGTSPAYTWFRNGTNLFLNSPTYTDNTLTDGDHVFGVVGSSLPCLVSPVVPSIPIQMHIIASVTPSITISSNVVDICRGGQVNFIASAMNVGTTPSYQWYKNGVPVGNGLVNYADNSFVNGDVVTCKLSTTGSCLTTTEATSNAVMITVHPDVVVNLDQSNSLCAGDSRILNAGNFSSYSWSTGVTTQSITVNAPGTYSVTVTDDKGCVGTGSTTITTLLPSPSGFMQADTSICEYSSLVLQSLQNFSSYNWSTGSVTKSITITQAGQYWLEVRDNNDCVGKEFITVVPKQCMKGIFVPSAFTPNNDGKNDLIKPIAYGNLVSYKFSIFNRWGQLVFQTSDAGQGWNGIFKGIPQPSDTFIWTCSYQFSGEQPKLVNGSFVLIR